MKDKDCTYNYISDQLDEVIERELDATRTTITKEEIKEIMRTVLWRCGLRVGGNDLKIKHEGYIDRYHRGLYIAVPSEGDRVTLYSLKPGSSVDILNERGEWQTVKVEKNPAAIDDPKALRVRLDVDDETPVIGAYARRSALLDMRPREQLAAAEATEIRRLEGEVKELEHQNNGDT